MLGMGWSVYWGLGLRLIRRLPLGLRGYSITSSSSIRCSLFMWACANTGVICLAC